jgi:AraC-like DNA-binding protein
MAPWSATDLPPGKQRSSCRSRREVIDVWSRGTIGGMSEPSMSMRLVRPFMRAMKGRGTDPRMLRFLEHADPDARILAKTAVDLLRTSIQLTNDEAFGLSATLETSAGDYGDMEYATGSCATLADALDFMCRYYFVLDSSCTLHWRRVGGRVHLIFQQSRELFCRAAVDFTLGMAYVAYVRWVGEEPPDYEVHFPYPQPPCIEAYYPVFGTKTRFRFDAPCTKVVFGEAYLDRSLRYSDPKLHAILASTLRHRYTAQGLEPSFIDSVRTLILEQLPSGPTSIDEISRRMGMSQRSLHRKLVEDGTTFRRLLSDVRCARAAHYLLLEPYTVAEISQRLGYSEPSAFHRAFRQWFGCAPTTYRESRIRP